MICRCFTLTLIAPIIILQVSPPCYEAGVVNYEVELNATYSDDKLLLKSSGDIGKHTVTLRSPNIRMDELYNCSVGIEGLSNSQSMKMELSMLLTADNTMEPLAF